MNSLINKLKNIKTIISFAIAILLLYLLFNKLDLKEFIQVISKTNLALFLFALVIFFLVFPILALRWNILLKNIGLKIKFYDLNAFILLQWFANSIIPAKMGDLYKAYLIKKYHKFSMSKIIGTIFVERLFDLIFVAVLSIGLIGLVFKGIFPDILVLPTQIIIALITLLIISIIVMKTIKEKIKKILPEKIKRIFDNFEQGVSNNLKPKDIPLISIYSLLSIFIQVIVMFLITTSIGLNITLTQAAFITMVAGLVTIIPITPAGVGVGEITITLILLMLNFDKNLAISAAILTRTTYWLILIFGGIFYFITSKK